MKSSFRMIVGLVVATLTAVAQGLVQVDFRNYIPGVLDAPVFYPDGVTRVGNNGDNFSEHATLYFGTAGTAEGSLAAVGAATFFQGATNLGYWDPGTVTLPGVRLGDRVSVQVRVWEYGGWIDDIQFIGREGRSKVLSLLATNPVMTLVGLESFCISPEPLWCELQDGEAIISWRHEGAASYSVECTDDLMTTNYWTSIFGSDTGGIGSILSVTNPIAGSQRFYRLRRYPLP